MPRAFPYIAIATPALAFSALFGFVLADEMSIETFQLVLVLATLVEWIFIGIVYTVMRLRGTLPPGGRRPRSH